MTSMSFFLFRAEDGIRAVAVTGFQTCALPIYLEPARRSEMAQKSGRRTVPQIWIGERHVGGCDDLYELDRQGELDKDRKSTRLNSSHGYISYAVFCLKKKKKAQPEAIERRR